MLSGFSGGGDGMSVLRWMIPPVFLFYLGCELILIYTRKFYRPSVPSRRCRYAAYSAQSRSECISQQVSHTPPVSCRLAARLNVVIVGQNAASENAPSGSSSRCWPCC